MSRVRSATQRSGRSKGDSRAVAADGNPGTRDLVGLCVELGLTHNESRVYLALVSCVDPVAASDVAARAGVPRPKVYEALSGLEQRGFCRSISDRVQRYLAVAPDIALPAWGHHRDLERAALAERDEAHIATLVRLLPRPAAPSSTEISDFITAFSGRLPISEAHDEVIRRAAKTLYMMIQPPFIQPRARWNIAEIEAVRRGVDVRTIYTPASLSDPRRYVDLLEAGGQARVLDEIPMKLLVCDKSEAFVSLRDANTGEQSATSARIRHPDLAAPLHAMFQQHWRRARPLEAATDE